MNIVQDYISKPSLRRSGELLFGVKWIVAHDTGNENSTAQQNVDWYKRTANDEEASAHAFVDDQGVIECIPQTEKAWHVRHLRPEDNAMFGGESNDWALGIELCFFPKDRARTQKAYDNYVAYIAQMCVRYSVNPLARLAGHVQLDPPPRRTDPMNAFQYVGKTWVQFLADVRASVVAQTPVPAPVPVAQASVPVVQSNCDAEIKADRNSILTTIINFLKTLFK